jgi:V/A-type H+-transporting ATPase subunit K
LDLYQRIRSLLGQRLKFPLLFLSFNLALFLVSLMLFKPGVAVAQVTSTAVAQGTPAGPQPESLLAAAIAMAGSALGSGLAVYGAATAGAAAMAERPTTATWVIILAGLGEGIAIYGLIIAIVIVGKA